MEVWMFGCLAGQSSTLDQRWVGGLCLLPSLVLLLLLYNLDKPCGRGGSRHGLRTTRGEHLIEAETASGPRSANTSQTIFELLGGARMSSPYLAYSLSHVSCPYASSVVAVPALIVGGARIKVKKFQSTSKMNERS